MATISLFKTVQLTHEARTTACATSGAVVALSSEGAGSLISADFHTVKTFTVSGQPQAAALSPAGSELAIVASDGIRLFSTATFEMFHRLNNAFLSCLYGRENLLWTCARFTPQTVVLKAWELGSRTQIAQVKVADPYGNSEFSLFPGRDENSVVLWAAAGQDGQCLFWATLTGSAIKVSRFKALDETCPPSFSPNGEEFLVTSEGALHCYAYPQGPLKGSLTEVGDDEDDPIGYSVSYIDVAQAVLTTMAGRLLLVDATRMTVIEEVALRDAGGGYDLDLLFPLPEKKVALVYTQRGLGVQRNSRLCLLARQQV
jgi:hypothetical protein